MTGDRGSVRELWDFGERTFPALVFLVREAARGFVLAAVFVRLGFLGLESSSASTAGSFSLSDKIAISELRFLGPFTGVGRFELAGLAADEGISRGMEGRGRRLSAAGTVGSALVESPACGICFAIVVSAYFTSSSPIFAFLRLSGIRLMRRSIRDLRSVAWRA